MFLHTIDTHHLADDVDTKIATALTNNEGMSVLGMNSADSGEDLCVIVLACHLRCPLEKSAVCVDPSSVCCGFGRFYADEKSRFKKSGKKN